MLGCFKYEKSLILQSDMLDGCLIIKSNISITSVGSNPKSFKICNAV